MSRNRSNRFAIVIILISLPPLQGTPTQNICDNTAERTFSRSVHVNYLPSEKTYDLCSCTIRGADAMTINAYRAANLALYCPSTLCVNTRKYNCSAYNGFSEDDRKITEKLHSATATTVTLNINSRSNQPILRMEFKGQSGGQVTCYGRLAVSRSSTTPLPTENNITTVKSQVKSESTDAFTVSTARMTTAVTATTYTVSAGALNATASNNEKIFENLPKCLAANIGTGLGVSAAIIFMVFVVILRKRCIAKHSVLSQTSNTNDRQFESGEDDANIYTTLNDTYDPDLEREVFNTICEAEQNRTMLKKPFTSDIVDDKPIRFTSNTAVYGNELAIEETGFAGEEEENPLYKGNACGTDISIVVSSPCDLQANSNNITRYRQSQERTHTYYILDKTC